MLTEFVPIETELAWAAGFFDGEGCFQHSRTNGLTEKRYCGIEISQAHDEVLHRFRTAVGYGNINGPYKGKSSGENWKPMWYYSCRATAEIKIVCELLRPYLSSIKLSDMTNMLNQLKDTRVYQKRLRPEEIDVIICEFRSGLSYKELANLHNRTYNSIVKLICSRGK